MNGQVERAYFAGGCFWGVEYHFSQTEGVLSAVSGFMGGELENPTYAQVCSGETGHLEVVAVEFDPGRTSFEMLARLFFEIHDFSQTTGQGPDLGPQYLSAIFHESETQQRSAESLVETLRQRGYKVATAIRQAGRFYPAEEKHQQYYARKGSSPYCHSRRRIF
jgi:peptide methionine sulfoxide reductase msrA/msrB